MYLIENQDQRLENIKIQIFNFQVYFSVYFLFIFSLILHQMFLPNLKLQYSLFILAGYHGSKVVEYVRSLFDKKLMNKYPW